MNSNIKNHIGGVMVSVLT